MKKLTRRQVRTFLEGTLHEVMQDPVANAREEAKLAVAGMNDVFDALNNCRNELMDEDPNLEARAEELFRRAARLQDEMKSLVTDIGLAMGGDR